MIFPWIQVEGMIENYKLLSLSTWSGRSPGGTHVYSSRAHPESSSDWECLWGSRALRAESIVGGGGEEEAGGISLWSSRELLQFLHTFLSTQHQKFEKTRFF